MHLCNMGDIFVVQMHTCILTYMCKHVHFYLLGGWIYIALKFTLFSLTNEAGDGEGES
jgi:hypothetical protein